jgi:hypothetical protein
MLELEIKNLRKKLDTMIEKKADYSQIYEISVQLDRLIVKYYIKNYGILFHTR